MIHLLRQYTIAMQTKIKNILVAGLIISALFGGCKKDGNEVTDPKTPENESEVITTIQLTFKDSADLSSSITATFKDPDGDGGKGPTVFDTIQLKSNKTYYATILLLDETKSPADTISNEVKKEGKDHLFFYHPTGPTVTVKYNDADTHSPPLPVGLSTIWKTGGVSTGTTKVILKHQPGVKNGTETPGDTDVDITFPTVVK